MTPEKSKDISEMTTQELESIGFRQQNILEQTRNNLAIIHAELNKRAQSPNTEALIDKARTLNNKKDKKETKKELSK